MKTTRAEWEGFSVHLTPKESEAFAAGLKEGRRLERSRLRKLALRYPDASLYILLTGAPKPSRKRKGGK